MIKESKDVKKCKICGKALVGKHMLGMCSACKKSISNHIACTGVVSVACTGGVSVVKNVVKKLFKR